MIQLTPDEIADVLLVKVSDQLWRSHGCREWWEGPQAYTAPDAHGARRPIVHLPGLRENLAQALYHNGLSADEHFERWNLCDDYVLGEIIHRTEITERGTPRVVPTVVNVLVERYFGAFRRLFGYQLGMWYSPYHINLIVGGRGSGKTLGLAIVAAIHCAITPGEDWLHVALIQDQANELVEKLKDMVFQQHYLSSGERCPRSFADAFLWKGGKAIITHPYTRIVFEDWNGPRGTEGNQILVRALEEERDAEKRRGKTVGAFSGDELMRTVANWETISKVADAVRGPNEYALASLSPEQRRRYLELTDAIKTLESQGRFEEAKPLLQERAAMQVEKSGRQLILGNSGAQEWVFAFEDEYRNNPRTARAWVVRASMYDNPNLTARDREMYEQRWAHNPEEREVEIMGARPVNLGGEISADLLRSAVRDYEDGLALAHHPAYGVTYWRRPPSPHRYYLVSADMGLDRLPRRNAPVITAWELNPNGGIDLAYFWWGSQKEATYNPFLDRFYEVITTYQAPDPTFWVYDSGGTQAGAFEVVRMRLNMGDRNRPFGYPMRLNASDKETAKKILLHALSNGLVRWPRIQGIISHLSNWNVAMDRNGEPQDIAMAVFMAVLRIQDFLLAPPAPIAKTTTPPQDPYRWFYNFVYPAFSEPAEPHPAWLNQVAA